MAQLTFPQRVEAARNGINPAVICQVSSGWVVLCDMQYLRGYCILLADPVVNSINALDLQARCRFMTDMVIVGDALLEVTKASRINYGMFSNSDPYLHAHIIPRYLDEPEEYRRNQPWSYPKVHMGGSPFDSDRDRDLMDDLARAIRARLV